MWKGGEITLKFGKGNESALRSTETDNIIDSSVVGEWSVRAVMINRRDIGKIVPPFWNKVN